MKMPTKVKKASIFERTAFSRSLVPMMARALWFVASPKNVRAQTTQDQSQQAQSYRQQIPEQLQQLVAPIALYPDSLVSQILAASTFPEQVVEADRWVQANPDLK